MLRLILVRHGRTAWNLLGRVQGGGELDDVGRAQVSALAERLSGERISVVYSSPALRARQTASAVAERLGLPVRRAMLLRDLNYGKLAGALVAEVEAREPGLLDRWRASPDTVRFEGGESIGELRARVARFIARTAQQHDGETVLAATHDSPVRVAASLALGLDDSQHTQERLRTRLASVTELHVDGELTALPVHNEVGHLQGIDGAP